MIKQKKQINGGDIYKIIKTIEDMINYISNIFSFLLKPIFWFLDYVIDYFFKPDGAMPYTWSHIYYFAFIIAIILFVCENIIIVFLRGSTDYIFRILNINSFNINHWIKFYQLNFILLYLTLFYKFRYGILDNTYFIVLLSIITLLFQKGLIMQVLYQISGLWINI